MSLFSQIGTPASTGTTPSLFGTTAGTTTPATGGLFGASPATTTSATTGGLFGTTTTPAATTAQTTGGLFGTTTSAAPAQSTGSLFGGGATTTPASSAGGGLFGSTPAATAGASSAPSSTGGLFGTASAATPAATGGLFGSGGTTTASSTPSLFGAGAGTGTSTTQTDGGAAAGKPAGSFGTTATTGTTTTPAVGNTSNVAAATVPAATVDTSKLTPTTRFQDCHESIQRELEFLEKHILSQLEIANQLTARFPTHRDLVNSIPTDVEVLSHKLATTKSFLSADQSALSTAQTLHQQDSDNASLSIRTLDLFRMPHAQRSQFFQRTNTFSSSTTGNPVVPLQRENDVTSNKPMIEYFNRVAEQMEHKLKVFLESVQEVEMSLKSVESQAAQSIVDGVGGDISTLTGGVKGRQDAKKLNRTLREFNDALRDVSGRIVEVRDGLRDLRSRGGRR